jgi:hypothetical protein
MSDRIPANARQYIKQVRANRQKQKQKQSNKQSQVVIINQEPKRRRAPNKSKQAPKSGYPNIVYLQSSPPIMNVPPQPYDQGLNEFRSNPIYQNPFRMQAINRVLNAPPTPLYQVERPLQQPLPSPPPPDLPDIVDQQNFVEQLSRPPKAVQIDSSAPVYQGFVQNQAVNGLARQVDLELNAFNDFGGADAQAQSMGELSAEEIMRQIDEEMVSTSNIFGSPMPTKAEIIARARGGNKK